MREMIMRSWCDACYADGELQQEAVKTYTIGIVSGENRPALKLLELCDTHDKIAQDLIHLLSEVGQLPDIKKPVGRPPSEVVHQASSSKIVDCPVCGEGISRGGLVAHIWAQHRPGETKPVYGPACPECRVEYDTGQGLAAHRRAEHGFDAVAEALDGVKGYKPSK